VRNAPLLCPDCRCECSELQSPCGRWALPPPDPASPQYTVSEYHSIYEKNDGNLDANSGEIDDVNLSYSVEPWYAIPDYSPVIDGYQTEEYSIPDYVPFVYENPENSLHVEDYRSVEYQVSDYERSDDGEVRQSQINLGGSWHH